MQINIQPLNVLTKMPTRADDGSAGYDLYAATSYDIHIPPHQTVKIGTGIALAIPNGTCGLILARSGIATNRSLRPANCVGLIDPTYRGELIVALHNDSDKEQIIEAGERIAQIIFTPYYIVEFNQVSELDKTERGDGGFGHSGRT